MDLSKTQEVLTKLQKEIEIYNNKSKKAKRYFIIAGILGLLFLIPFITILILVKTNILLDDGIILIIIFGILAFIFIEVSLILFIVNKLIYEYQKNSREKLKEFLLKEISKMKNQ